MDWDFDDLICGLDQNRDMVERRGRFALSIDEMGSGMANFLLIFSFGLFVGIVQEISGLPTSLKREPFQSPANSEAMGESSSSGTARLDKQDSFRAL